MNSYKTPVISYNDGFGFKLMEKSLADKIISDSLERLYDSSLIGSKSIIDSLREETYVVVR